jgi:NitT/TauT family transport system ATP-binding protein
MSNHTGVPRLKLTNVCKRYTDTVILKDVSFSLHKGELAVLVGQSGCGKSTLLRLIVGQEQPTTGTVEIGGVLVERPSAHCGIIQQHNSLYPHLSVLDNVLLGKRITSTHWKRDKKENTSEAYALLDFVGMAEHAKKYPYELSGGMNQRVSFLQSLIMQPDIILMDEPFGALDPQSREDAQAFLLDMWKKHNITVLLITHDMYEAALLGSRIIALSSSVDKENPGANIVLNSDLSEGNRERYSNDFKELALILRKQIFGTT